MPLVKDQLAKSIDIEIKVFFFNLRTLNRVRTVPGNPGKYLNFSLAFSRTGKSLKMVGVPRKSWKSVNSIIRVFLKDITEQPIRKFHQLENS